MKRRNFIKALLITPAVLLLPKIVKYTGATRTISINEFKNLTPMGE